MYRCAHTTESQNSSAFLGTIWSDPWAGAVKTACSRVNSVRLLISPRMKPPQSFWATYFGVRPRNSKKSYFFGSHRISYISLCLSGGIIGHCQRKCLAHLPYSPVPSSQIFKNIDKVPCSLLFHRLNNHNSTSAYMVLNHLCDLFLGFLPAGPCLSCTGEPRAEHSSPEVSHQGWTEGQSHLPWPAGHTQPDTAQEAAGHTLWLLHRSSQFFIICKHAEGAFGPIFQVTDEENSQYWPSINPWGTAVVTGLQLDFELVIFTLWVQQFSQFSVHLTVHLSSL